MGIGSRIHHVAQSTATAPAQHAAFGSSTSPSCEHRTQPDPGEHRKQGAENQRDPSAVAEKHLADALREGAFLDLGQPLHKLLVKLATFLLVLKRQTQQPVHRDLLGELFAAFRVVVQPCLHLRPVVFGRLAFEDA